MQQRGSRQKPRRSKKKLDSFMDIFYIQSMFIMNLLTLSVVRRAAWQHKAVAEGRFY
jgi:hypothetical protein